MKKTKSKTARYYLKKYLAWRKDPIPVTNKWNEEIKIPKHPDFIQCYKKGVKGREDLPKFWFVDHRGRVISFEGKSPLWLSVGAGKRPQYTFYVKGKRVAITQYNLVALVFQTEKVGRLNITPRAMDQLERFEVHALGKDGVIGHHIIPYDESRKNAQQNNNPYNIQFMTSEAHRVLTKSPLQITSKHVENGCLKYDKVTDVNQDYEKELLKKTENEGFQETIVITGTVDQKESQEGKICCTASGREYLSIEPEGVENIIEQITEAMKKDSFIIETE